MIFDYFYLKSLALDIITIDTDNGCIEVSGSTAGVFVSVSDDTDDTVASCFASVSFTVFASRSMSSASDFTSK